MQPQPVPDPDSLYVIQDAIETLALLRGTCCPLSDPDNPHDPADALKLAWHLALQIDAYLPQLIDQARDHGYSWNHIRACLNLSPTQ